LVTYSLFVLTGGTGPGVSDSQANPTIQQSNIRGIRGVARRGLVLEELVSAELHEFFGNKFSYFSVKGVGHIILCVFASIIFVSLS
jgi:hypothetical protein